MSTRFVTLRRIAILMVASVLAWRVVSIRMSEYQAVRSGESAPDKALAWNANQPLALYRKSLESLEERPETAQELLRQAYIGNPAAAEPLLAQAALEIKQDNPQQATALVEHAAKLMPANARVQQAIAMYWAKEGNLPAALRHWSQAMTANPASSQEIFPILLKVVESPSRNALKPLAISAPPWWDRFFTMVTRQALDLESVRALYTFRRASSSVPLTDEERNAYIRRLQKEGLTAEAYLTWLSGLSDTDQAYLGTIYNGSFELEPTNTGFDWHFYKHDNISIRTTGTYGIEDKKALRVIFKRREKPAWRVIYQPLFLDPGVYRASGMVRTDGLDSLGGLKWSVRCTASKPSTLGESERFLGSSEWKRFTFEVQVPGDCPSQELRLMPAGSRDFEHKITGEIWFDKLAMYKIPKQSATTTEGSQGAAESTETAIEGAEDADESTEPGTEVAEDAADGIETAPADGGAN